MRGAKNAALFEKTTQNSGKTPKIKLCGLTRPEDVEAANALRPEFVGFVFAPGSRRWVAPETAARLRRNLSPETTAVGVFVDAAPERIAALLESGVVDVAQLHGRETAADVERLRAATGGRFPIVQAFQIASARDVDAAAKSVADSVLLDSGAGSGTAFDRRLLAFFPRPYFLAGGLDAASVCEFNALFADGKTGIPAPIAFDVSSGIETNGRKDPSKMAAFVRAVRENGVPTSAPRRASTGADEGESR